MLKSWQASSIFSSWQHSTLNLSFGKNLLGGVDLFVLLLVCFFFWYWATSRERIGSFFYCTYLYYREEILSQIKVTWYICRVVDTKYFWLCTSDTNVNRGHCLQSITQESGTACLVRLYLLNTTKTQEQMCNEPGRRKSMWLACVTKHLFRPSESFS